MNKVTLVLITILLCSCDHATQMQPSNFQPLTGALANAQAQTKKGETIAKGIATNGTKPGSKESSELLLTFQSTEAKQAQEEVEIKTLSLDDKTKTDQGNANLSLLTHANMELRAEEPKKKRDYTAMYVLFWLGFASCAFGPIIREGYVPLQVVPPMVLSIIFGFLMSIILSGIAGLLILFGVL